MCGIVGEFNLDGRSVSPVGLRRMTHTLAHRGPDGEGFYIDNFIGLGHRRLAIIDLSPAGHQPMLTADRQYAITYNGELYNFQELRAELQGLGHRFISRSDTEVVLNAYVQWGPDCVHRFNGMFAFAIWDQSRQELFLARDRYGVKPLYYAWQGRTFYFSSELKAILVNQEFNRAVSPEALLEYFTFQNIFTDRTLFQGIHMLPAGCRARLPLGATPGRLPITRYWDFFFRETDQPADETEYVEELHRLFAQAVKRQLVSDVPVGAYLSGGMDSGAITAVAAREIPYLASFTAGFDLSSASGLELGFDERHRAESLSYRYKTEHYEVVLKAGDMERVFPDLIWHLEDLRVGQCYPNYYVSRLASKFIKVILGGTGGDELFAGYPWRYYRAVDSLDLEDYVQKYYKFWQRLVPNKIIHRLFQPHIWREIKDIMTVDIFRQVITGSGQNLTTPEEYLNSSLYFECKTFLHGILLVEDKLSMAHSLESRVPFLDNDLVDFAMQLPVRTKLREVDNILRIDENEVRPKKYLYFDKTNDGKLIFRSMLGRYLPPEYTNGVKQGFSAPDASWFRGESIDYVRQQILDPEARIYEFLRPDTVAALVGEHLQGEKNRRLLIWSLLSFEWWLRKFLPG